MIASQALSIVSIIVAVLAIAEGVRRYTLTARLRESVTRQSAILGSLPPGSVRSAMQTAVVEDTATLLALRAHPPSRIAQLTALSGGAALLAGAGLVLSGEPIVPTGAGLSDLLIVLGLLIGNLLTLIETSLDLSRDRAKRQDYRDELLSDDR